MKSVKACIKDFFLRNSPDLSPGGSHVEQQCDDIPDLTTTGGDRPNRKILLACFPKSGSTFTSTVISNIGSYERKHLLYEYGAREQELDEIVCYELRDCSFVAQHHVRYNKNTEKLISAYDMSPIVLVRNIYDCIPSLVDHIRKESYILPWACLTKKHANLSDPELHSLIADLILPWYINFYVSWVTSPYSHLLVRFEDMVASPEEYFEKILTANGYQSSEGEVKRAIEQVRSNNLETRFNQGLIGRGASVSGEVRTRVAKLVSYYPSVDFSPIGV